MGRQLWLKGSKDFANVFRKGHMWANDLLILRAAPNSLDCNRYGFSVSKRLGKAVIRNKVRRRLREGIRTLSPVAGGWDVVISARTVAAQADFWELKRAVASLLTRAGIMTAAQEEGDGS
jgi:ribonuclease P protein component